MQDQHEQASIRRGAFGMPKPQGWTLDRVVTLMAGAVVLSAQILGRDRPTGLRVFTGFVGVNLMLNAVVGWCPMSVLLHRLGVRSAAERR